MFRITKDPSSGSDNLYLTEITCNGSQIFIMCVIGVWRHNSEPLCVCVCVRVRDRERERAVVQKSQCAALPALVLYGTRCLVWFLLSTSILQWKFISLPVILSMRQVSVLKSPVDLLLKALCNAEWWLRGFWMHAVLCCTLWKVHSTKQ